MDKMLAHPRLERDLKAFIRKPAHALLITGTPGSGKTMAARAIGAKLLDIDAGSALDSYPYFFHISRPSGKQDIPIESIRELNKKLRLKTPGEGGIRRIVLIEDAQYLSHEAQNALLKNLEEPSLDTLFILTASSDRSLLPTIASRARHMFVPPVSLAQAKQYFEGEYPENDIAAAWQLSQGTAGLLHAILSGNKNHPMNSAVEQAKEFLVKEPYERMLMLDAISKDRQQMVLFLDALSRTCAALERAAVTKGLSRQASSILSSRRLIADVQKAVEDNAAARLAAMQLVLNLKV